MYENSIASKNNVFFKKLKKIYSNSSFRKKQEQTILDGPHLIQSFIKYSKPLAIIEDLSVKNPEIKKIISDTDCPCYSLSHE